MRKLIKHMRVLCALICALTCIFLLSTGVQSVGESNLTSTIETNGVEWFAAATSYADHHYGAFGGVSVVDENSVRILAKTCSTSGGHIGFMLKKETIKSMIDEGYQTVSFKVVTEAYESNDIPGFVNVYASGVNVANYQLSIENGTRSGTEDIFYASGSVVKIDLVKLYNDANFTDGLKFVVKKAAASGNPAGAPAYLVLSEIEFTKVILTEGVEWFAAATSYADHYYGAFGGVSVVDENSVRILAKTCSTSGGHIGFMLKKETIKSMIDEGYQTVSFKMVTEAYESNDIPGFVNVYASGINVANYQLSIENGTRSGTEDIFYASGSVVEIDLVKLYDTSFTEGLKFVLKNAAAPGNPAGAPAYLVLSDFQFTKAPVANSPFEQMTFEESYDSYANGEFGGVTATGENSVQILAKEKDGVSGFMLKKDAVEKLLLFGVNEMTFTLNPSAYNSGSVPEYVVLDSPAAVDYVVNYESVAAKVDGNKLYFAAGTEITIRLHKLYADITAENGLKFALLNGDSWESGGVTAYLTLANLTFAEKVNNYHLDLVTSNGDFVVYYQNEATWAKMTELSIRAVAEAGFKYIDLSLYRLRGDSDLMKDGWEDTVQDLKTLADELGVEFRQAHSPGYPTGGSEEWIATNKRSIEVCNMLGIKNLVVHASVRATKDLFFTDNAQYYGYILPYAAQHGVNILCENSTYKNMSSGWCINDGADMREFIKFVQAKGYSNFHGCWDTGHANCEGSQYLDIIALGDEMHAIHFHDNMGTDTHMIPYYGNMDIDEVMRALKMIGYNGDFTLETDGTPRISSTYTGPELEGGLDPYSTDRFIQEKIIYQIMTYILEKYDCTCTVQTYGEATCETPATCSVCGATTGDALGHKDENKDHICDRDCSKIDVGTHGDANTDHACDYGCAEAIGTHAQATGKHTCDYCGNAVTTCTNFAEVVKPEALKSAADCTNPAVYYKSCTVCGANGTETFTSGEAKGHTYDNGKCTVCQAVDPDYVPETDRPQTGDDTNLWLWAALLFVSGGAIITLAVYDGKKRKGVSSK